MPDFQFYFELLGAVAFAVSGAALAVKKGMDLFGVAVMGMTTAVGGGILRDMLLGLTPPKFLHFPLLLASDGRRLSKRDADAGLDTLRDRLTAAEVLGRLAYLAGFNHSAAPKTAEQLLVDFAWDKVPREDIRIPEGLF